MYFLILLRAPNQEYDPFHHTDANNCNAHDSFDRVGLKASKVLPSAVLARRNFKCLFIIPEFSPFI